MVRDLAELTDEDRLRAWEQATATHLKAPLEAVDLHFMVEGVTRAFTHQMVRQRTAVYAQESMRFAVKEDIAARPGPLTATDPAARKDWEQAVEAVWLAYKTLIAHGVPAEEARGLLPHDTLTRLNYKTNLRNLVDHLGNRLCTQAQFEWRMVGTGIVQAIAEYPGHVRCERCVGTGSLESNDSTDDSWWDCTTCSGTGRLDGLNSWQWRHIASSGLFKPVCFAAGRCPFKADFDRGCTIRERVDAGKFADIDDREWLADPTAGWVR